MINTQNITIQKSNKLIIDQVDFSLNAGECVGIIGPNGAGKSSLMRAILGFEDALGASSLWKIPPKERAKQAAWLDQTRNLVWDLEVEEIIALGRAPYRSAWSPLVEADNAAIYQAAKRTGSIELFGRRYFSLSGGEAARVQLARALAQETPFIFADEPVANLDPAAQIYTMSLLRELADEGQGIAVSIHDLGLAARFCTRLVLMNCGKVYSEGQVDEVLTDGNISKVFGVSIFRTKSDDIPILEPLQILKDKS